MKKQEIEAITNFLNDEVREYDLDYDYEIEDNTMIAIFKGSFIQETELRFRVTNGVIELNGLCESYICVTTREFWINLMGKV